MTLYSPFSVCQGIAGSCGKGWKVTFPKVIFRQKVAFPKAIFVSLQGININLSTKMARPIKGTPALTGKDAEKFLLDVAQERHVGRKVKDHARNVYERFKAIATFTL